MSNNRVMFDCVELAGRSVSLIPMDLSHVGGLLSAALEDRASYAFTTVPSSAEQMENYVTTALAEFEAGWALPFTVVQTHDQRIVGSTRFLDIDYWDLHASRIGNRTPRVSETPKAVEIGGTWYASSSQRTSVNTEAKLLLLHYAFEVWKVFRVSLKTDARNVRSRNAIERIGARFEGVRRAHHWATDGTIRDSAHFSILRHEWPEIHDQLAQRLKM